MFRIAALVAGALAGFLASLILALGGLEISDSVAGGMGPQQVALARYALIFIANLSLLGAGVVLAIPRAGAVLLALAAIGWAAAAVILGNRSGLVLFGPPALDIVAVALAICAEVFARRAGRDVSGALYDPYDVAPAAAARASRSRDQLGGMPERDYIPGRLSGPADRNGRISEKPAFREVEYDDEPDTGMRRASRALTSALSFGLYAAAAGGILLVGYNVYRGGGGESSAALVAAPTEQAAPAASSAAAVSVAEAETPAAPVPSIPAPAPEPVAAAPTPEEVPAEEDEVLLSPTPLGIVVQEEQPRVVGEAPPPDAVPAGASSAQDLEPIPDATAGQDASAITGTVDSSKVPPTPATMSSALAEARRNGTGSFVLGRSDM